MVSYRQMATHRNAGQQRRLQTRKVSDEFGEKSEEKLQDKQGQHGRGTSRRGKRGKSDEIKFGHPGRGYNQCNRGKPGRNLSNKTQQALHSSSKSGPSHVSKQHNSQSHRSLQNYGNNNIGAPNALIQTWLEPNVVSYCSENKVMYIMRGLPGSGKSSVAHSIFELYPSSAVVICSADDFRINEFGEYVWNEMTLQRTHLQCQAKAKQYCHTGTHVVVIDNTNMKKTEFQHYLQLAVKYDYAVILIVMPERNSELLAQRNSHKVSLAKIEDMKSRFESVLPYYYGWNIGVTQTRILQNKLKGVFHTCFQKELFAEFSHQMKLINKCENLYNIYHMKEASSSSNTSHVTACFINEGKASGINQYIKSPTVHKLIGSADKLNIIGWCITTKSLFARVLLDENQKQVWGRNDSFNSEVSKIAVGTLHTQRRKLEEDLKDLTLLENKRSITKISSFVQNIDERYLAPGFGLGSTAHITMGIVGGLKHVTAGNELYKILQNELNDTPIIEYNLPQNLLRCYNDNLWVVYLREAIVVPAMFCGFYQ